VPTTAPSPALVELARVHGVATEYWSWQGEHVLVSAATIVAVLAALGVDAGDDDRAAKRLAEHRDSEWRRVLPQTVVTRVGVPRQVAVHVPHGSRVEASVELEDGGVRLIAPVDRWVEPRTVAGVLTGEATVELPGDLPLGWHVLRVETDGGPSSTTLVVTPQRLELPKAVQRDRVWGVMTQLYSVRSRRSWGIGDLADLADLGAWAAGHGADFVLVNPLHAAEPIAPMEASPYLPTTRRFVNPMYLRVEDVPEVAYLSAAERQLVEWHGDDARRLSEQDAIDRDAAWAAKLPALRIVFRQPRTARRERAFESFRAREGQGLVDFATWCALAGEHGLPWTAWPAELQDPRSPAVVAARDRLPEEVEFHCWLQWIVSEQLAAAQREVGDAGMSVGVVHDLAVGVHPQGADAWALGDALATTVNVGAPPDQYNQLGQDWSQPPWRPDRLAELGYAPYREMLRTVLRDAGGLRVDHIIGLFRLWWVPKGRSADEGTYVRYDHEALVGILALEAHRAGALVVGEDLGVVEPWVRDYLTERGILGTSILWFEKNAGGAPLRPESYRELCLSTVTTHDLPPTAGYLDGVHIDLRAELDLLTRPVEEERIEDEAARERVLQMLRDRGLLRAGADLPAQVEALHRFLTWTPSRLLGVSVADLAGDRRTINQPGTDKEYPNWRLPLAGPDGQLVPLEELMDSAWARRLARSLGGR
jgi:4-alpha-glucanotransferase